MALIAWRVALVVGGVFLLIANSGGEQGTFLGLYPPTNPGRIGFDLAKLGIAALALWFIASGLTGRRIALRRRSAGPVSR